MSYWDDTAAKVEYLKGKVLTAAEQIGDIELVFTVDDGSQYRMFHVQDCCESVSIESIVGDLQDLVGHPILMAEEATSGEYQPWETPDEYGESFTWTFYKFATIKGYVDIRWHGQSNGYYSESVDFMLVSKEVE
jgi:hypothetical protein